jgi:hypothetical protein
MNAKEHIQALVDEGLVRVEKIGAGNWYWTFVSEAKRARETLLGSLQAERDGVAKRVARIEKEIQERKALNQDEEDVVIDPGDDNGTGSDVTVPLSRGRSSETRVELMESLHCLRQEINELKRSLDKFQGGCDLFELEKRRELAKMAKLRTEIWTENCWVLEGWVRDELKIDRQSVEGLLKECYGEEYVEGEGLSEL